MPKESQFTNDPRCIEIEEALNKYADSVVAFESYRREYFRNNGSKYGFKSSQEYNDKGDNLWIAYNNFFNKFFNYVDEQPTKDLKKKLAGRILWKIHDKYVESPKKRMYFLDDGLSAISKIVEKYPLPEETKIKFLFHLIRNNYHREAKIIDGKKIKVFSEKAMKNLAQFDINKFEENFDENKAYNERSDFLLSKNKKDERELLLYLKMHHCYINYQEKMSVDDVRKNACTYFMLIKNLDIEGSDGLLNKMIDRSLLNTDGKPNDDALFNIFNEGVNFIEEKSLKKQKAKNIEDKLSNLAEYVVENYNFNDENAKNLMDKVFSGKTDKRSKRLAEDFTNVFNQAIQNKNNSYFARKRKELSEIKNNQRNMKIAKINVKNIDVNADSTVEYAENLFDVAKNYKDVDLKTDDLYRLLTHSGDIDKKLLLDVVDIYGKTYTADEMNSDDYNENFHNKFAGMLKYIVTKHNYSDKEVRELTYLIAKGAEATYDVAIIDGEHDMEEYGVEAACSEKRGHEEFQRMAEAVYSSFVSSDDLKCEVKPSKPKKNVDTQTVQKIAENKQLKLFS